MKKQIAFWTTIILLGATVLYAIVRESESMQTPQGPPAYSLSQGPVGMVSGGASYFFSYNDSMGSPIPADDLVPIIRSYLETQGDNDLSVARVREFRWVYQAEIVENSTGRYAFGLMIGKETGQVTPKAGPNIFWNTKYGSRIAEIGGGYGMIGRLLPQQLQSVTGLSEREARQLAATAVKDVDAGLDLDNDISSYYGFYEYHVVRDGQIVGEMDVNVFNGQVWYKDWGEPQLDVLDPLQD
ncbi:MAG: hypothetical protein J5I90_17750 [Caldilineales bacterium]|nr:hypothetical protein [Caldilineales bacterium]